VADIYAVGLDTVKRWRAEGMPGKNGQYVLHDISKWLRTDGPWKRFDAPSQVSDDPLLAEGDSPALERYRLAKAKHAELDLEHRKGELIEVGKCRDILGQWASVIRKMGDRVSKRFGIEANLMVTDAIDACQDIVRAFDDSNN
jgi:phage terminase Nu1 subunit (DNA packaging protein)